MLLFFANFINCWGEEVDIIATNIMLRAQSFSAYSFVKQVSELVDEPLKDPSFIGAWIDLVERPPYNINAFNHWRFTQTPINNSSQPISPHSNQDDLVTQLSKALDHFVLLNNIVDPWSFNMNVKTIFGLLFDAFSPLHNAELFSSDFPNGDDSGRNFPITYDGINMSLYTFWDTGCYRFHLQNISTEAEFDQINSTVTDLLFKYPPSLYFNSTQYLPNSDTILNILFMKEFRKIILFKPIQIIIRNVLKLLIKELLNQELLFQICFYLSKFLNSKKLHQKNCFLLELQWHGEYFYY